MDIDGNAIQTEARRLQQGDSTGYQQLGRLHGEAMTCDVFAMLPDAPLHEDGAIAARFNELGVGTFRDACRWVRDLPYGANAMGGPAALFEEQRGTCRSKHGVIALLARELQLPIEQFAGAYRLDESVVDGIGPSLSAYGLRCVPQIHCVLKYEQRFFDLTEGNCHGKKKDVTDMDVYFRVTPFASDDENCTVYVLAVQYYQRTEPALSRVSVAEIRRIARACSARAGQICAVA